MNTAQRVENILKASKAARNSDTELLIIYMQKSGMNLSEFQKDKFRDMPAFETITRIRRKLQEQGKYSASKEVEESRYNKFSSAKGSMGVASPNHVEQILSDGTKAVLPPGYRIIEED